MFSNCANMQELRLHVKLEFLSSNGECEICAFIIGRERKIAVEKGRPSTSQLITGVPPVTFSAGASESDHSGVAPVKMRWSGT